jgi:prevent-host-death family protein
MADTLNAETITAREANQQFSRLLAEVAAGKSYVITRHGVPVARLAPEPAPDDRRRLTPERQKAWEETLAFARSRPLAEGPVEPVDREWLHDRSVDRG